MLRSGPRVALGEGAPPALDEGEADEAGAADAGASGGPAAAAVSGGGREPAHAPKAPTASVIAPVAIPA